MLVCAAFKCLSLWVQTQLKPSGFFRVKKVLSTPSFRGEVKPLAPCHRFVACTRFLNGVKVVVRQNYQNFLTHIVPPFVARISCVVTGVEAPGSGSGNA